ncbi:MAG: M20/M25/M40 family metallo-hydrolase [Schumannella sp.]
MGQALGAEPERMVIEGVPHLCWRFGTGVRQVLILAHHDTVYVGTLTERPFTSDGGVLRGPGVFDMKAGLAMGIALAELGGAGATVSFWSPGTRRSARRGSRAVIEDAARETGAVGARALRRRRRAQDRPARGLHVPRGRARPVRARRPRPAQGRERRRRAKPIASLAVAALGDPALGTTVTTVASAGTTSNTVPASALLEIDVRAWTLASNSGWTPRSAACPRRSPESRIDVEGGGNRPPLER